MYKNISIIMTLCLAFVLAYSPLASAEYVAYAVVDGKSKPLPENIDNIEAKELVNVKWGNYNGNKSRVGVLSVENSSKVTSVTASAGVITDIPRPIPRAAVAYRWTELTRS